MVQEVIVAYPPLFPQIDAKFNVHDKPILYAWGDKIYNPLGVPISSSLHAHEAVHGQRQGNDIEAWWFDYLNDVEFRLNEELIAHQAEYKELNRNNKDRNLKAKYLWFVAQKLSSPLYGKLINHMDAMKELRNASGA
jgi:hypothetical protein